MDSEESEDSFVTFDEAMHTECKRCGQEAQHHRMTNRGHFYCLLLNRDGIAVLNHDVREYSYSPGKRDAYNLPVRFLYKARFENPGNAVVGTIIKDGLKNYVGQADVA
jgi:hypothetical protein